MLYSVTRNQNYSYKLVPRIASFLKNQQHTRLIKNFKKPSLNFPQKSATLPRSKPIHIQQPQTQSQTHLRIRIVVQTYRSVTELPSGRLIGRRGGSVIFRGSWRRNRSPAAEKKLLSIGLGVRRGLISNTGGGGRSQDPLLLPLPDGAVEDSSGRTVAGGDSAQSGSNSLH